MENLENSELLEMSMEVDDVSVSLKKGYGKKSSQNYQPSLAEIFSPTLCEDVIIEICKYLPISSIKQCQQVNTVWNRGASVALKKKARLSIRLGMENNLEDGKAIQLYTKTIEEKRANSGSMNLTVGHYRNADEKKVKIPTYVSSFFNKTLDYEHLRELKLTIHVGFPKEWVLWLEIWRHIMKSSVEMLHLELRIARTFRLKETNMIELASKHSETLKSINLEPSFSRFYGNRSYAFPKTVAKHINLLMRNCSKLEKFLIPTSASPAFFMEVLPTPELVVYDDDNMTIENQKSKLSALCKYYSSDKHQNLISLSLPRITFYQNYFEAQQILYRFAKNLTKLELGIGNNGRMGLTHVIPRLPHLKRLKINFRFGKDAKLHKVTKLSFFCDMWRNAKGDNPYRTHFPVLEELMILPIESSNPTSDVYYWWNVMEAFLPISYQNFTPLKTLLIPAITRCIPSDGEIYPPIHGPFKFDLNQFKRYYAKLPIMFPNAKITFV